LIGCIIQARTGSSRLPNKVIMKINKKQTVLEHVIKQLSFSKSIDKIIVATTQLKQDDVIENIVKNLGIDVFRGDSLDVLNRYYQCAKKFSLKNIVRITSDCPLIDPYIVDKVIKKYETGKFDFVTNTLVRTFPIGMDVEIFSFDTLRKVSNNATLLSEREHVTPFIRNKKMYFTIGNIKSIKDHSKIRITLDRKEDFVLIKKIINKFEKKPILIQDIINLFEQQPELIKINENIKHTEGMQKSLKQDKIFAKIEKK
jgi:spore coat polysaccharide biosynthesis protein SpsF